MDVWLFVGIIFMLAYLLIYIGFHMMRKSLAELLVPLLELLTPAMFTITDHGILVMVVDMSDQIATDQNGTIIYDPSKASKVKNQNHREKERIESGIM